ncbi:MAG: hypothetical protein ISS00_02475 [Candidatus Marinimicrobia bacterium]|nr:hypothetical protein [Candidatus Neomarinimicrobiota bacterium]
MKIWRKTHRFGFGYFRWLSIVVSVIFIFIAISGILLEHRHIMSRWTIPTWLSPDSYIEKLEKVRISQGNAGIAVNSVPVEQIVWDLHSGTIFGKFGWLFYDLIAVSMTVLSITGIYMFWKIRSLELKRGKGKR